jgi:hypothetical protein
MMTHLNAAKAAKSSVARRCFGVIRAFQFAFCFLALLVSPSLLRASDFGLLFDQNAAFAGSEDESDFNWQGSLVPWFSALAGKSGDFYISASFTPKYENEKWLFVPELSRTEFDWRFNFGALRAGRINHADPLGFIANGLFDGASFSLDIGGGTVSVGSWYTGLLYKDTANITMTAGDQALSAKEFTVSEFADTYFASRRILSSIGYEHPAIAGFIRLKTAALWQSDCNDTSDKLHSQYFVAKITVPVKNVLIVEGGGALELENRDNDFLGLGLAGEISAAWMPPTSVRDRLLLTGRYASGRAEEGSLRAFSPVTTKTQGSVLKAKLSGLSLLQAEYTARLHETFSVDGTVSYFFRTDRGTWRSGIYSDGDGYALGGEFFARGIWSPASDLNLTLGAGAFLPQMGNASTKDAAALWRIELGATLALY